MDRHRITKVLFEYQAPEEPAELELQVEKDAANRSIVTSLSKKILKDEKEQPKAQAAEGDAEKETDSPATNKPVNSGGKAES